MILHQVSAITDCKKLFFLESIAPSQCSWLAISIQWGMSKEQTVGRVSTTSEFYSIEKDILPRLLNAAASQNYYSIQ